MRKLHTPQSDSICRISVQRRMNEVPNSEISILGCGKVFMRQLYRSCQNHPPCKFLLRSGKAFVVHTHEAYKLLL